MKIRSLVSIGCAVGLLGACATSPSYLGRSGMSFADQDHQTIATIFVWSNDQNAGLITKENEVCMQRAMTARSASGSLDGNAQANVPASTFSVLTAAAGQASQAGNVEAAATMSAAIAQAASALSATSERTAFLDIGMFYLCQLSANGSLTGPQPAQLTLELIQSAAEMTPTGTVPKADAPAYRDKPEERQGDAHAGGSGTGTGQGTTGTQSGPPQN